MRQCKRCGKIPRFRLHLCRPTFDWIDSQFEDEVQAEIKRCEKEFKETGTIKPIINL